MFHFCPLKSLPSSDPHQKLGAEHCESNGDHSSVCSMCPMRKVEPPPIFESTKDPSQGWFNVWAFGKRAGLLFMWTGLNSIPAADWGGGGGSTLQSFPVLTSCSQALQDQRPLTGQVLRQRFPQTCAPSCSHQEVLLA